MHRSGGDTLAKGATVGMYGELQGIAGRSLEEIEGLDVLTLASPSACLPTTS